MIHQQLAVSSSQHHTHASDPHVPQATPPPQTPQTPNAEALAINPSMRSFKKLPANYGVPVPFLIKFLEDKYEATLLQIDLCYYIPFVILFIVFFMWNKAPNTFYMTKATIDLLQENDFQQDCLTKNFNDIRNEGDWFNWFRLVTIPILWNQTLEVPGGAHYFGGQNQLLGALRIRQLRGLPDSCNLNEHYYDDDPDPNKWPCWAGIAQGDDDMYDKSPFFGANFQTCEEANGIGVTGYVERYPCGGHIWDIPFDWTPAQVQKFFDDAIAHPIVDPQATRLIIIEFFSYNGNYDSFLSSKMWIEVLAGGAWYPDTQLQVFRIWTMRILPFTIIGLVFMVYVFYFVWRYIADLMLARTRAAAKGTSVTKASFYHILSLFNLLELCNLLIFLIVFVFYFFWWLYSLILPDRYQNFPYPDQYPSHLDRVLSMVQWQIYLNSMNSILSFVKFLKYVKFISHLNVISSTLLAVSGEIYGVLVLMFLLVGAYAVAGMQLYGSQMDEFRTFWISTNTLLRVLIGDFDYASIRDQNRYVAGLYFWTFIILGLFMLLNFVIAVITDGFAKTQSNNQLRATTSLYYQITYFVTRVKAFVRTYSWKAIPKMCTNLLNRGRGNFYVSLLGDLSTHERLRLQFQKRVTAKLHAARDAYAAPHERFKHHSLKGVKHTCSNLIKFLKEEPLSRMTERAWADQLELVDWSVVQEWDSDELEKQFFLIYFKHFQELTPYGRDNEAGAAMQMEIIWSDAVHHHKAVADIKDHDDARLEEAVTNGMRQFIEKFYTPRIERLEDAMYAFHDSFDTTHKQTHATNTRQEVQLDSQDKRLATLETMQQKTQQDQMAILKLMKSISETQTNLIEEQRRLDNLLQQKISGNYGKNQVSVWPAVTAPREIPDVPPRADASTSYPAPRSTASASTPTAVPVNSANHVVVTTASPNPVVVGYQSPPQQQHKTPAASWPAVGEQPQHPPPVSPLVNPLMPPVYAQPHTPQTPPQRLRVLEPEQSALPHPSEFVVVSSQPGTANPLLAFDPAAISAETELPGSPHHFSA